MCPCKICQLKDAYQAASDRGLIGTAYQIAISIFCLHVAEHMAMIRGGPSPCAPEVE